MRLATTSQVISGIYPDQRQPRGGPYTRLRARLDEIESPESNGMAEAFVRTIKRDYVRVSPCPDAKTVMHQLSTWINHYNEVHPHKALGYRSPREFIAAHGSP
jgi:putative transposase